VCVILMPMSFCPENHSRAGVIATNQLEGGRTMVQRVNADRLVDPELPGLLDHLLFSLEPVGPLPD